jgi:hypothetical protein
VSVICDNNTHHVACEGDLARQVKLEGILQICATISRFARRFPDLRGDFQICNGISKFARRFVKSRFVACAGALVAGLIREVS